MDTMPHGGFARGTEVMDAGEYARPARFTVSEVLRMNERGAFPDRKIELKDGEIVDVGTPGFAHGLMQHRLGLLLGTSLLGTELIIVAETGIELAKYRMRAFDYAVLVRAPRGKLLAPTDVLVGIEIADTTIEQDMTVKVLEYAEAGVPTYWVVDVNARVTHVMQGPGPFGYARRDPVAFADALEVPGTGRSIVIEAALA